MKNNKHEHPKVNDEETVKQLVDGLEKLDQWHPVSTPNLHWFQQNVELEKKRIRKKMWKDLLTFIAFAVLLFSVMIAVVYHLPVIFIYIQLVGILLLPFALKKNKKEISDEF